MTGKFISRTTYDEAAGHMWAVDHQVLFRPCLCLDALLNKARVSGRAFQNRVAMHDVIGSVFYERKCGYCLCKSLFRDASILGVAPLYGRLVDDDYTTYFPEVMFILSAMQID
jgi:hypothetical protein